MWAKLREVLRRKPDVLDLLEADVPLEVAEKIVDDPCLRIRELLDIRPFDPLEEAKDIKPYVILFVGPNGMGKTTAVAKIGYLFKKHGYSVVLAAADTYRAGAIEQLEEHGRRIGVRVIKQGYGADPAAVAYDAVEHAKARGVDCVLIDTAGRQETNRNLLEELKKIKRVVRPHRTILVLESTLGNSVMEKIREFSEVGVDGAVMTKMDVDTKGGSILGIVYAGIPVIYMSYGQDYESLEKFDKEKVIKRLCP